MHESNGIDNIIALILNDINPLGKERIDLVLELKNNASKLLLAIMESRADSENAERILISMSPRQLVEVASNAYFQKINENNSEEGSSPSDYPALDDTVESVASGTSSLSEEFGKRTVCAKEVGHNIYILCHQLAQQNKELAMYLKSNNLNLLTQQQQQQQTAYGNQPNNLATANQATAFGYPFKTYGFMTGGSSTPQIMGAGGALGTAMQSSPNALSYLTPSTGGQMMANQFGEEAFQRIRESLSYYAKHTAQIEIVRSDRTMERIVFPVPPICEYLTKESKNRIFFTIERDEQGSKVSDFFQSTEDLFNEMKWQKELREQPTLYWISRHMSTWSSISFTLAVLINLIVAIFHPFDQDLSNVLDYFILKVLLWIAPVLSLGLLFTFAKRFGLRCLIFTSIFRLLFSFGINPVLLLLGLLNILTAGVHMISIMGNHGIFTKKIDQIVTEFDFLYHIVYLIICALGLLVHPFFYSILLFNMIYQEETLKNVIRSVTRNGRSILLTALLALILIYSFSIVGYLFFRDDYLIETDPSEPLQIDSAAAAAVAGTCDANDPKTFEFCNQEKLSNHWKDPGRSEASEQTACPQEEGSTKERWCDSMIMCIITTLNQGLRNGGGIGDVLRSPSSSEPKFIFRVVYDMLFYFILIVITLNLIFGVIIDTFADLRSEKQQKDEILKNTCFICGLDRSSFDNKAVSFEEHIRSEHNLWHYLYFIVLIKVKDRTEFTGPESYVNHLIEERNLDWFPRMRAMSLISNEDSESEQNEMRQLNEKLDQTNKLITLLSQQLMELREQVRLLTLFGNSFHLLICSFTNLFLTFPPGHRAKEATATNRLHEQQWQPASQFLAGRVRLSRSSFEIIFGDHLWRSSFEIYRNEWKPNLCI